MVVTAAPYAEIGPRIGDNLLVAQEKSSAGFERLCLTTPRRSSPQCPLQHHRVFA